MTKVKKPSKRQRLNTFAEDNQLSVKGKPSIGKGVYQFCYSYFYSNGMTPQKLVDRVVKALKSSEWVDTEIMDSGNHWAPFHGGAKAGSARDTYMWVNVKIS